jgi:hypothetical protein
METGRPDRPQAMRRLMTIAFLATAVLLVGGVTIALLPALVFHSGLASSYGWYPEAGMFVALGSLIPANIGAALALSSRMGKALLVVLLIVLTVVAGGILFVAFTFIYLSTIDWFVF